jgi:hypothetical protein
LCAHGGIGTIEGDKGQDKILVGNSTQHGEGQGARGLPEGAPGYSSGAGTEERAAPSPARLWSLDPLVRLLEANVEGSQLLQQAIEQRPGDHLLRREQTAGLEFQIPLQCIRLSSTVDCVAAARHMNPYPLGDKKHLREDSFE